MRVSVVESVIPFRVPFRVDASCVDASVSGWMPRAARYADRRHEASAAWIECSGDGAQVAHLIDPRVTPEITQRCEKMYTISSGAIAIRYDAKATV